MRRMLIFLILIGLTGCASESPFAVRRNRANINHLEIGMTRDEVVQLLGEPRTREVFSDESGKPLEVLFYQTAFVGMAYEPGQNATTPIIFRNKEVIGWGEQFYDRAVHFEIKQTIEQR